MGRFTLILSLHESCLFLFLPVCQEWRKARLRSIMTFHFNVRNTYLPSMNDLTALNVARDNPNQSRLSQVM